MPIAESLLPEFDQEMATTRKLLERVPEAQAEWKPHPKSMSVGQLAIHLADLVNWVDMTVRKTEFDLAPPEGESYVSTAFESSTHLLETFDANVASAREALAGASDADLLASWTLKKGGQELFTMPRIACIRTFVVNHVIHHRGQLSVFLRLLDVPLPPIYGPTADEAFGG